MKKYLQAKLKEKCNKKKKGFTLVELIVVLVILGILAALLIPALTGYIDNANEKKVAAEARTALMAAQTVISDTYGTKGDITSIKGSTPADSAANLVKLTAFTDLAEGCTSITSITIDNNKVTGMTYTSDSYTATYTVDDDGKASWTIS